MRIAAWQDVALDFIAEPRGFLEFAGQVRRTGLARSTAPAYFLCLADFLLRVFFGGDDFFPVAVAFRGLALPVALAATCLALAF